MAIEEPPYQVLQQDGAFEIRHYAPQLVAQTWAEGDMDAASNRGFRRIANFIFGNNQVPNSDQSASIAMTAPVTVEPVSPPMAMKGPLSLSPTSPATIESATTWRIQFVMPKSYTLATLPQPRSEAIEVREVPSKTFLVHRYSWFNTTTRVQEKIDATLLWAQQHALQVIGAPQLARYDPPWTLPMFKRNEIHVEIALPETVPPVR